MKIERTPSAQQLGFPNLFRALICAAIVSGGSLAAIAQPTLAPPQYPSSQYPAAGPNQAVQQAQQIPQQPAGGQSGEEHPLAGAIRLAEESLNVGKQLSEYRVLFTKREVVSGQMYASQIDMKFRQNPFSVYLRFVNPEHAGREVLFVQGRHNNEMLAHDSGIKAIVGTVSLDPNGSTAMAEARHPITQIGIANLADGVVTQWKRELAFGETDVKYYPEAKLGEQAVIVIESSHPRPRREFPYQMTRLWIDKQTRLPVRVQQYEFPRAPGAQPVLVEEYTYTNVNPNPRFTEVDFDPRNPQYQF